MMSERAWLFECPGEAACPRSECRASGCLMERDKVLQAAFGGMPASAYKPEPWLVAEIKKARRA